MLHHEELLVSDLHVPADVHYPRCCEHGQYDQAVGVALEGRRLDKLEQIVMRSSDIPATLAYALRVCQKLVINRDFRRQVCGAAVVATTWQQ